MRWPPYKHIFFDCDSTLTTVEGIDSLAETLGKGWRVSVLTEAAMEGALELEEIYEKRLRALRPTRGQIHAVRQVYKNNVVPDAAEVIDVLQSLEHKVYIISGGLAEPVLEFGLFLGIPRTNIRAVNVEYDQLAGEWWQQLDDHPNIAERYLTYREEPLTVSDGKGRIIRQILEQDRGRSLLIGDGVSDLLASWAVDLFVGFGGVTSRDRVLAEAPIFINSLNLAPLLALALGPAGLIRLKDTRHNQLYERTLNFIRDGAMVIQSEQLRTRFENAWSTAYQAIYPGTDRSSV